MSYSKGIKLPGQTASKLGHINVIESPWVKSLIEEFESPEITNSDVSETNWKEFNVIGIVPLRNIWAVDGSYVSIQSTNIPPKEVTFVKTALLIIDRTKLDRIDKENPHPLLLQDILKDSAVFHSTVFPLKNVRTSLGNNYDTVRHIVRDSIKVDENGAFYETLKWLVYSKWNSTQNPSPSFECPHCHTEVLGLPPNADFGICLSCNNEVFLTDMIGFHLDMDENSAPESVASAYMLIMEHLMLFTAIRLLWNHSDKKVLSETLFMKDGPLSLNSQYSKLIPSIREFLDFAHKQNRPIHIIGQEKSGRLLDHLRSIVRFPPPHERDESLNYAVLTHNYIRQEIHRSPNRSNPYGSRTNWGEKMFVKIDPGTYMVLSIPTGNYNPDGDFPKDSDLIGLNKILATLPSLVSHKFEGALYPIELADGIASMSSYPSAKILQRFIDSQ